MILPGETEAALRGCNHAEGTSGGLVETMTGRRGILCYVDGNLSKPAGFDIHLLEYRDLFARVESVQSVCVDRLKDVAKAERIFRRLCGTLAAKSARVPSDLERLLGHFRARVLLERRETACFDKQQLDRLRDELREFQGPEYEELYKIWREHGDGAVLCGMQGVSTGSGTLAGIGSTTTTGSSAHFPGGAGMKRTDYFRRQQNPRTDPGLNALVAGLAQSLSPHPIATIRCTMTWRPTHSHTGSLPC